MGQTFFQVDSFTSSPLSGNPAAVMVLEKPAETHWMQLIAREMNLSETAYLVKQDEGYSLRWFTPTDEVDLCGHATLASAHILWETGAVAKESPARFHTRSGILTAKKNADWIEMDFPTWKATPIDPPPRLEKAFRNIKPTYVGIHEESQHLLMEVATEEEVLSVAPNFSALKGPEATSVILTTKSNNPEYDFISRYFAPNWGIDEDPVTGSAHCVLGPHWSKKLGKQDLVAFQASARGGSVRMRWDGSSRIAILGQAVTVFEGRVVV